MDPSEKVQIQISICIIRKMKNVKKEVNFTKFRKQKKKKARGERIKMRNITSEKYIFFFRERGKYNQKNIKIKKI